MNVSEEELIEFIKPILKEQGFRKKAKRWTKTTEHFSYIFFNHLFYSLQFHHIFIQTVKGVLYLRIFVEMSELSPKRKLASIEEIEIR